MRKKHQSFFDTAQVALFRVDVPAGRLLEINEQYARLVGYTCVEDCIKKNFHPFDACACPDSREQVLNILSEKKAISDFETQAMRRDGQIIHILFSAVVLSEQTVIEGSIMDITRQKQLEKSLQKANDALKQKTIDLEHMHTTLNALLKKNHRDIAEMEKRAFSNYEASIQPFLEKLKSGLSEKSQQQLLMVLEKNLADMFSPFSQKLSDPLIRLSPSEMQVASMIKQGLSNKDIADILNKSIRTIDTQRASIRKKLHLTHKTINLQSFLLNL